MSLKIQIYTIITSILYGIFIYYFLYLNKKIIYNKNYLIRIIGSLSIMILLTMIFFLILLNINHGYLHIYELIIIVLSYFIIAHKSKKWYNLYGDNMSKRVSKKAKQRLFLFGIPCLLIILYFIGQLFFYTYKIYNLKKEEHKLNELMEELKEEEKDKKTEIEKLNDPDYIARYVRENYSYSKNGEYIIKIKENTNKEEKDLSFTEFILEKIKGFDYDYAYIIAGAIVIIMSFIIISSRKKD